MIRRTATALLLAFSFFSCAAPPAPPRATPVATAAATNLSDAALVDDLQHRSFQYFWDLADPRTLLIPDRAPTPAFSSIAAVGFGLTAYGIGAERGYVTREQA